MSTSFPLPPEAAREPEHPLARAFASFTEAAGSLERAYGQLQRHVAQLRQELEVTNRDLASSLAENHRIRERLRRILEGLPCGVLVIEAGVIEAGKTEGVKNAEVGSQISVLNPEAVRLLGRKFELAEALPPRLSAALDRARQTEEETELPLCNWQQSDSDVVLQNQVASEPLASKPPGAKENVPGWIAIRHAWLEHSQAGPTSVFILRDVSEAKKLEQEREQFRRQQALVEVSALLAHEIRNPLGSLELFAGLLAEANLEGESHRWIEHVQAGLRTLSATVNNVLQLHSTHKPELPLIDAGELLDWVYDFISPLARHHKADLQVINGLRGIEIPGDRHRLEQVLLNLAINAFNSMPEGGRLSIRGLNHVTPVTGAEGRETRESIEIEVRDTGAGIAAIDVHRIFDTGFTGNAGNLGLGLAICRRTVEEHNGSIGVESRPGWGATFRLQLPRNIASAESVSRKYLAEQTQPRMPELLCPAIAPPAATAAMAGAGQ
jgi:signal transduction histidine kinase